jgi:adenosylmethionine-8-amino-7-oxononanoate aminotransferase
MSQSSLPAMLYPFARPTATEFLRIVRGEGTLVFDDEGNDYVDATSSRWFATVGHGRTQIADAVAEQMKRLAAFHTFERFSNDTVEELSELLVADAPMDDARVFFTNSGSEAADTGIKIARAARTLQGKPEKSIIVAVDGAFHGVSYAGISVGGIQDNKNRFGATLPDVIHVPRHDIDALRAVFEEHGDRIALFMIEPVLGAAGVYPPPEGFLTQVRELCDEHDVWLLFDEVVTGFGRLGTMWASRYFDVRPDLVMFAKGVTSGYFPMGGVFVGADVRAALESDPEFLLRHGHTYSGHPAASAAALANIRILREENLIANVPHIGARIREGLDAIHADGLVDAVRSEGAMCAVQLPDDVEAVDIRERMIANDRVIVRAIGRSTIAMSPPFVTTDEQIDRILAALRRALADVHAGR